MGPGQESGDGPTKHRLLMVGLQGCCQVLKISVTTKPNLWSFGIPAALGFAKSYSLPFTKYDNYFKASISLLDTTKAILLQ